MKMDYFDIRNITGRNSPVRLPVIRHVLRIMFCLQLFLFKMFKIVIQHYLMIINRAAFTLSCILQNRRMIRAEHLNIHEHHTRIPTWAVWTVLCSNSHEYMYAPLHPEDKDHRSRESLKTTVFFYNGLWEWRVVVILDHISLFMLHAFHIFAKRRRLNFCQGCT